MHRQACSFPSAMPLLLLKHCGVYSPIGICAVGSEELRESALKRTSIYGEMVGRLQNFSSGVTIPRAHIPIHQEICRRFETHERHSCSVRLRPFCARRLEKLRFQSSSQSTESLGSRSIIASSSLP